jgi:hypothetical protein
MTFTITLKHVSDARARHYIVELGMPASSFKHGDGTNHMTWEYPSATQMAVASDSIELVAKRNIERG